MTVACFSDCADAHVLVVGWGSIGRRHARLFASIGGRVTIVSRRGRDDSMPDCAIVASLAEAATQDITYIIIARETASHFADLCFLAEAAWARDVPILVEKPLVATSDEVTQLRSLPDHFRRQVHVGFNMRFLPVVMAARRAVPIGALLIRAEFQSRSFLPHWRPTQDYRTTSSARRDMGGGVLRDLSHELDLALWFCDMPTRSHTFGGQLSGLKLDVEDNVEIVCQTPTCKLLTVSLSYSQHIETRALTLISEDQTVIADLLTGALTIADADGAQTSYHHCADFDDTYRAMHHAVLRPADVAPARFKEGASNTQLITRLSADLEATDGA